MAGDIQARNEMNAAMNEGKPYKSYRKTILGEVFITVLDALTDETEGVILQGDPHKNDPDSFYHTWSKREDTFFNRAPYNREHLKLGRIIEIVAEEPKAREKTLETSSDEELVKLVNSPFLALQNALNKTQSVPFLFRLLTKAQDLEKSDKIVKAIEARLSEVQELEFAPRNLVVD